uniref:Integrase catalytic domain-containing protein n=1 Tax=Nicotiana tabacum TaxID=4097 RepID=A0A1S3ZGC3_TOBAC|nr:PREDICTED: uncharacterized protein LOC107786535 [Nicotiana tabacum]
MAALMITRFGNQQRPKKNYNLQCDVCHMKGHTKETCYRVVGYKKDKKFRKKYNSQATVNFEAEDVPTTTIGSTLMARTFTQEQYQQILQLLKGKKTEIAANATGMDSSIIMSLMSNLDQDVWIVDSGASNNMDLYTGKALGIGSETNGLCILKYCIRRRKLSTPTVHTTIMPTSMSVSRDSTKLGTWHQRLGHLPMEALKRIDKFKNLHISNRNSDCVMCHVCPLARQTRLPFPVSTSRAKAPLDLLHANVWGPFRVPTYDSKRFFLIVVNDFSRITWLFLMNAKDETCWLMKRLFSMISTQFDCSVKILRTYNGSEFVNLNMKQLVETLEIIRQTTCVYTPQQNGIVERRYRYILETTRALRFQAAARLNFWDHLRVFGYLCYAVNVRKQDKFSARDVVFKEHVFPLKQMKMLPNPLLPVLELTSEHLPSHVLDVVQEGPPTSTNNFAFSDVDSPMSPEAQFDIPASYNVDTPQSSSHVEDAQPIAVRKSQSTTGPPR